jgi:hypothetical protein
MIHPKWFKLVHWNWLRVDTIIKDAIKKGQKG